MSENYLDKVTIDGVDCNLHDVGARSDIDDLLNNQIIATAGPSSIVSISDGAEFKARDLTVGIEPVQSGSGDPSPTNVRPITGWTGANVSITGLNKCPNLILNKTIDNSTGAAGTSTGNNNASNEEYIAITANSFTLGFDNSVWNADGSIRTIVFYYDTTKTFISRSAGVSECPRIMNASDIPAGARYIRIKAYRTSSTFTQAEINSAHFMMNEGTTLLPYVPYTGTTIPITFPSEAGTVYGGTLDVTTGLLTVDRAEVDLGNCAWTKNATNHRFFSASLQNVIKRPTDTWDDNAVCSEYKAIIWDSTDDRFVSVGNNGNIYIKDASYDDKDATEFKTAMSGVQLVYELATPVTYQLTPTEVSLLKGHNNIWADTGDSTLTYITDVNSLIGEVDDLKSEIGTTALPTTAQTITGAIAEHETDISDVKTTLSGTVKFNVDQSIGSANKARARNNIGAASSDAVETIQNTVNHCVKFSSQTLTDSQKEQARTNIGAASETDTDALETLVGNTTLPTTAQTVTGAIAEHETDISNINSAIGTVPSGSNLQGEVDDLKSDLENLNPITEAIKVALLDCIAHVAWTDEHGQNYYDALETVLYESGYPRITATFNSGSHNIYNVYAVNDLKQYLTVKYFEDRHDEGQTIASSDYILSGILNPGDSVIRVSYDELATTFVVPVSDFYNKYHWNSVTDVDVLSYYNGLANTYTYDGVMTVKLNDDPAYNRRILVGKYGYTPILDTDGVSGSIYYGMPIPENASSITITFDSTFDIAVQWKKYGGDDYIYTWIGDSGWQNGPSYTSNIVGANVFWLNVRRHNNGTITSNPVIDVVFE